MSDDLTLTIDMPLLPSGTKKRWRPLYGLINGLAPNAWVCLRFTDADDVRKARMIIDTMLHRPTGRGMSVTGVRGYAFKTKSSIRIHQNELFVCKIPDEGAWRTNRHEPGAHE